MSSVGLNLSRFALAGTTCVSQNTSFSIKVIEKFVHIFEWILSFEYVCSNMKSLFLAIQKLWPYNN